jgi:hypothetical protein
LYMKLGCDGFVMITSMTQESTDQLKSSLRIVEGSGIILQTAYCI